MYDLDRVLNFDRYGVMAEHVNCLIDFSKGACEVIVRNPFVNAAAAAAAVSRSRQIHDETIQSHHLQNKSPAPRPVHHHHPVIIATNSQHSIPIVEPAAATTTRTNQPRANTSAAKRQPRATCTFCGKSFGHLGDYNKHRRRHTGERPYACDSCPRRFAHASNLQRHRRLHSGEKPFECLTCAKRFSRKDKLAAHAARRCCKPSA